MKPKSEYSTSQWVRPSPKCIPCTFHNNQDNNVLIDNSQWQKDMVIGALKQSYQIVANRIPEELVKLIIEYQLQWKTPWCLMNKSANLDLISDTIVHKPVSSPSTIRGQFPLPSGWSYFEIVIYNPQVYSNHPNHLNRHFIGVITDEVSSFDSGLAHVVPGYWGINESINGWWFRNGSGSRAPGVRSFLQRSGQVTGVLTNTTLRKMWFFLDDYVNVAPLDDLPPVELYPAVLLRDKNSASKIMFPRNLPPRVENLKESIENTNQTE